MLSFYRQFAAALQQTPVVLATIVQVKGSTPREVGAKMVIRPDGTLIGTIGGGAGEGRVIYQALQVFLTGEKQWVEVDLTGVAHRETQGVCGGKMSVWLERWQDDAALALVNSIVESLESGRSFLLITPLVQDRSPYLQLTPNPDLEPALNFQEVLTAPPTLLIIGAGHCAVPLAQVAHLAGFQVIVQDDRPEFAHADRFPTAIRVFVGTIAEVLQGLDDITHLYVALVTRGYQQDLAALRILVHHPLNYLGMIGSEKRVRTVYQALQQEGIPPEAVQHIHAPIGLDIGALTPEEIAISIGAELIKVRRGGTGESLSERLRQLESGKTLRIHTSLG